ncbi:MAG: metallophosphoesterase [Epsilonproteobacteria bacterium]|nr:MAG: metallophosphoesterase [Campylobacterota bacterium]
MKIVCTSDTHHKFPEPETGGDIFIHCGDFSFLSPVSRNNFGVLKREYENFFRYLKRIRKNFRQVIFVPGNHDFIFENFYPLIEDELEEAKITVLIDSSVTFGGIKFWGSPITPPFNNWAFSLGLENRKELWDTVPNDTDVVITHGPPRGVLDFCSGDNVGCASLRARLLDLQPKYFISGHVHEGYGKDKLGETICLNVSHMDEFYNPTNKLVEFKIKARKNVRVKEEHIIKLTCEVCDRYMTKPDIYMGECLTCKGPITRAFDAKGNITCR